MRTVQLTRGFSTIVDSDQYDRVSWYSWYSGTKSKKGSIYAICNQFKATHYNLSNFILDVPNGIIVDHINGDTLDNRKSNLRVVTKSQNAQNSRKPVRAKGTTSKYKGVNWDKTRNCWRASIQMSLGRFSSELEAAKAYDKKAKELFGDFARLNISET